MRQPKVFISYSHDSEAHRNRVFGLSERLRSEGVDCHIDQYEFSPPEGWPRWMRNQIRWADFVLVVCTETYQRRFEGTEKAGRGAGAKWEGAIITQELYEAEGRNTKFIPVVFSAQDTRFIPLEIRSATFHIVDGEEGYEGLYRHLTDQPRAVKGRLGKLRALPALERKQDFSGQASAESTKNGPRRGKANAAAARPKSGRLAPARPPARPARSLILIISPDGRPLFVEAQRIESSEPLIRISLLPADPREAASIGALKKAIRGQPIAIAYGTTALWARVSDVKQVIEQGRETWNLDLQPDEAANSRGGALFGMNFNNYTSDDIAEMRARRILLNEKIPAASGSNRFGTNRLDLGLVENAVEGGYGPRLQVKSSPFPALFSALKGSASGFLAAAKLYAVLQLLLTNTVESIHRLDLRLQGKGKLSVKFEGQRAPRYSNQPAHIIKVEGTCSLLGGPQ